MNNNESVEKSKKAIDTEPDHYPLGYLDTFLHPRSRSDVMDEQRKDAISLKNKLEEKNVDKEWLKTVLEKESGFRCWETYNLVVQNIARYEWRSKTIRNLKDWTKKAISEDVASGWVKEAYTVLFKNLRSPDEVCGVLNEPTVTTGQYVSFLSAYFEYYSEIDREYRESINNRINDPLIIKSITANQRYFNFFTKKSLQSKFGIKYLIKLYEKCNNPAPLEKLFKENLDTVKAIMVQYLKDDNDESIKRSTKFIATNCSVQDLPQPIRADYVEKTANNI